MNGNMHATRQDTELISALHVPGPAGAHVGNLKLFGRFVGSWHLDWTGHDADGQPGEGQPPLAFHGSTIRFYDPAIDAWRSTWIEPVNGRVRRFIGRSSGEGIVLLSDEEDPHLRWCFTDITADSFTWRGETSHDGGATWQFDEQMLATRVNPG